MAPVAVPQTTNYPPGTIIGSNIPGYPSSSATSNTDSGSGVGPDLYVPVIVVVLICFMAFVIFLRLCWMKPRRQGKYGNDNGTMTRYGQSGYSRGGAGQSHVAMGGIATTGAGGVVIPPPAYAPPAAYCGDGGASSAAVGAAGCSSGGASGGDGGGGGC